MFLRAPPPICYHDALNSMLTLLCTQLRSATILFYFIQFRFCHSKLKAD